MQLNETNETHDDVALSGRRSRAIKVIDCWQSALLPGSKECLSATMITKGWYGQKGVLRFYFVREYRVHVSSQSLVSYFQLDFEKKSRLSAVYKAEDTVRFGFLCTETIVDKDSVMVGSQEISSQVIELL